jgi:pimeloyl-ACP methyl ester carboxylesterase
MSAAVRSGQFAALSNGTRLHYASAGEKGRPLMLFLHGFPECWFAWQAQLEEFGKDDFAVAPDLRGFNLSDMPTEVAAYKPKLIAEDLNLLMASLGYEQCVLVAHDWGGAIAWNIAIAQPDLVQRLIIINATHPLLFAEALAHDPAQQAASEYMNWLRAAGSEGALAKDDFRVMEQLFVGMGQPAPAWFDVAARAQYHACWSRGLTGGVNYYRASPLHPPTATEAGAAKLKLDPANFRCSMPVRVIWGELDRALLPVLLEGLESLVSDLKIERLADASHWVIHEQPHKVNQLIRRFLIE